MRIIEENSGYDQKFLQGTIKRITASDIKAALIIAQARIMASDYVMSNDPATIAQYLAEIHQTEIAVDLCLAFKISPAYPVAMILKDYHRIYFKEGETDYQGINQDEGEESKITVEDS